MTQEEYKAKFSEDDAPGWDAIEGALEKIYDPANERHYSSQLHASLGGEDYLAGVSIFDSIKGATHRHVVSFGMSELYYDPQSAQEEFSGWGFEFSMRIAPFADDCGRSGLEVLWRRSSFARAFLGDISYAKSRQIRL